MKIVTRVTIKGSKTRVSGWRLVEYNYDPIRKVCKFVRAVTKGMYPNKFNYKYTDELTEEYKAAGVPVVVGRPTHQRLINLGVICD